MGSSSKTSQSTNMTTTPQAPSWITDAEQGTTNKIMALGNTDPSQYVAGNSDLQNAAYASAAPGSTEYNSIFSNPAPSYTAANYNGQGYTAAQGTASSLLPNLNSYMSPYTDSVVNSTLAQYDKNAGQTRAQDALDMAGSGALGGSGAAITNSLTNQNLAMGRNTAVSGLYDQAFNTGAGLSNEDAGRQQEMAIQNLGATNQAAQFGASAANDAAQFNAGANNTQSQFNAQQLADQQTRQMAATQQLAALGGQQQQTTQNQLSAPISLLGTQVSLLGGQPLNMFVGQNQTGTGTTTTTSNPGLAGIAGLGLQAASIYAKAGSDTRLKKDIVKVGELPNGIGVYDFNYKTGGPRYRGAMAQEVQHIVPEAVSQGENGYLMVDYSKIAQATDISGSL